MITCKKDVHKAEQVGVKGTVIPGSTFANKLIGGGGNTIASIACGVSIGTTKDLKIDFGAVGDGVADDSPAFLKATDWINANWSTTSALELYIPTGAYRVGVQLAPGATYPYGTGVLTNPSGPVRLGFDMLKLNGVKNVYIHGDPGQTSKILYKNALYFGGMMAPGSPCDNVAACNTCGSGGGKYATVGNFISLTNCSCITIEELDINGNAQNCQLMGHFGECNGYELPYDGIDITNGNDITISNTNCNNFGRDGLMTVYSTSNPVNITLTNLNCISNCRQGFSFTAGDNIQASNCKFNNTGSIFRNNPASGMDIEPDGNGGTCINSVFTNCQFDDNASVGMISDDHYPDVSNIYFYYCEFSASVPGSYSIWPKRMSSSGFVYCTIRGSFVHVAGTSTWDRLTFYDCLITDFNASFSNPVSGWNKYLMDFGWAVPDDHYYQFQGCTFDIHHSKLIYTMPSSGAPHSARYFEGNDFVFHYADMRSSVSYFGTTIQGVGDNSSGLFQFPSLGNIINSYLVGNKFTETAPTPSLPTAYPWYWVGICLSCGSSNDNTSYMTSNSFPQDGVGSNPWTRVCLNDSWPSSYWWTRGPF